MPEGEPEPRGIRVLWNSIGKKISWAVLAGALTFVSGAYELAYKAFDAQRNRKTIDYLSGLAMRDMERGEYDEAEKCVQAAEQIDVKSFTLITTRAALNTLKLVDQRWKTDKAVPDDIVFQLEELGLSDDEANFCMAMSATTNHNNFYDQANAYFDNVGSDVRLMLLARLRRVTHVQMPQLTAASDDLKKKSIGPLTNTLSVLDRDIVAAAEPHPIRRWITTLTKQFEGPMRSDIASCKKTLQNLQAALAPAPTEAATATVVKNLEQIKRQLPVSSPLAAVADDQLQRAYLQQQEINTDTTSGQSDVEQARVHAISLKRSGNYDGARKALQDLIARYGSEKRAPDATLYQTYFGLAQMEEYHYNDLPHAEGDYRKAEEIVTKLGIKDPMVANTLGYFYYRQARGEQDPSRRTELIANAQTHLKLALTIDDHYSKSLNTLDGLTRLQTAMKVTADTKRPASAE
jgi:tetratricopeptide (TPR) repeat protein